MNHPSGGTWGSSDRRDARPSSDSFADTVRARRWTVGTVVSSPDPVLAERIARAFDFVWIDLEHSALTIRDAQMLAIAISSGGAAALVRLPASETDLLGAVLDAGVDGVVVPRVETASEAERVVTRMRYPPLGLRGFAPRRATLGHATSLAAAPQPVCLVQIESRNAVRRADEIAAVDGVDGVVVGTADLSFDMGSPLDMSSPALAQAATSVGKAAERAGTAWGVAIGDLPEWVPELRSGGASLLVFASDSRLYAESVERCSRRLRAIAANLPESA